MLANIINSFKNKYEIHTYERCYTLINYRNQVNLYPSIYNNLIIATIVSNYVGYNFIIHINNVKELIHKALDPPHIINNPLLSTLSAKQYTFIDSDLLKKGISQFDVKSPSIININNDLIILEKDNIFLKIPFSNCYINMYFYYNFNLAMYNLYPLFKYLKSNTKEYTCKIHVIDIYGEVVLHKNIIPNNITDLKVRIKFREKIFQNIILKMKSYKEILSFLNIDQFKKE